LQCNSHPLTIPAHNSRKMRLFGLMTMMRIQAMEMMGVMLRARRREFLKGQ
jgi:hypothetical protein